MSSEVSPPLEVRTAAERMAREQGVAFHLKDWTVLHVTGPDRHAFLHAFCTNDIKGLVSEGACEAFITNVKGRILGHVMVLNHADRLTLLSVPGAAVVLVPHLQMYSLGRDVEIRDDTSSTAVLCVTGPLVEARLRTVDFAGETPLRYDLLGLPTWCAVCPLEKVVEVSQQLDAAGLPQTSLDVFQTLRIAAGFPWQGIDISEEHLAQEAARTPQTISFRKGCYLGQEPIARLDAMGHTNKELRLLVADDVFTIPPGTAVMSDEVEVGKVSSTAISGSEHSTLALAVIKIKHAVPGTKLTLRLSDGVPVTVRPFVTG